MTDEDNEKQTDDAAGGPMDPQASKDLHLAPSRYKDKPKKRHDRIGLRSITASVDHAPDREEQAED